MGKKNKEYHKLPGSKKGFIIGRYTLWQSVDHLLHIYSRIGFEDYKRYYFSDVQAIITRKTIAGRVQNGVLAIIFMLCASAAGANHGGWFAFWAALAGVFILLLLINLYRGPTCETKLMTAVQTEKLPSLHRLKSAIKVMDKLSSHIQSVQGRLSREDLDKIPSRRLDDNRNIGASMRAGKAKTAKKHEKGRFHLVLFALLVIGGILTISDLFSAHIIGTILSSVAGICTGIFVIIALVRQHNSDMPYALRTITWITFGFVAISFLGGYVVTMASAFMNPGVAYNQWELYQTISRVSPWENPLLLGFEIFTLCGSFFLGIPGLVMLKQSGRREKDNPITAVVSRHRPVISRKSEARVAGKLS